MASPAMNQPPEVLQKIMAQLLLPDSALPYTNRPLIHITGHPRAKILPLIYLCKAWYIAAVPLLYRDILIARLAQLKNLNITLKKPECAGLKFWLESIEIRDMIPSEISSSAFQDEIRTLLQTCPNLTQFAYTHCFRLKYAFYAPVYPWLTAPIKHLRLECVTSLQELVVALKETSPTLISLYISLLIPSDSSSYQASVRDQLTIHFDMPHLHTLAIPQTTIGFSLISKWKTPNLKRLIFSQDMIAAKVGYAHFLTGTGNQPSGGGGSNHQLHPWGPFQGVACKVEVLELNSWTFTTPICHPKLKWIDVWVHDSNTTAGTLELVKKFYTIQTVPLVNRSMRSAKSIVPEWLGAPADIRSIRIFPKHLYQWSHLPYIDPPTSDSSSKPRVYQSEHFEEPWTWHQWLMEDYESEQDDADFSCDSDAGLSGGSGIDSSDSDADEDDTDDGEEEEGDDILPPRPSLLERDDPSGENIFV
ncbi:hypothetical protein CVT24_011926 [Panaeolus cyanescens]|uniref:F-box domain-containing protein n=1 Tax=Panaeolus cyanescens TaxID=181874 RepID=A0A409VXR9_9AGAR|nr:hypothetical protein CVT24_011926 [Panaeolus cyanescens]